MSAQFQGRRIALFGASGQLGAPTLKALLAQGIHSITIIKRQESTNSTPLGVTAIEGDITNEQFLTTVLKGQDVVLLMPPMAHLDVQMTFIRAAARVGVPYIFPSEFGSDPFAKQLIQENELLRKKKAIRDLIEELGISSWISITSGVWLDFTLKLGLWDIDHRLRKATIWRGADGKASLSSVSNAAKTIASVLALPEVELAKYRNRAFYMPMWHLTQREILDGVQGATGTTDADWDITIKDLDEVSTENEARIRAGDMMGFFSKFVVTHVMNGYGGDFSDKVISKDIEKLGLQDQDIVEAIGEVISK
ncbi:hypothetical protein NQ176_g642 [Zarea fungicola]|uniref:Uncharacterized protein n=1 Tax=Zarea fungicola TaxID=93591 RepID=A0ACC1NX46_9HYPO|nr:hypothetical protein NQ176_g642 [Lecanicillium fungicola]